MRLRPSALAGLLGLLAGVGTGAPAPAQNLLQSGEFDDPSEVTGWTSVQGTREWNGADVDACALSGSLLAISAVNPKDPHHQALTTGPCHEWPATGAATTAFVAAHARQEVFPFTGGSNLRFRAFTSSDCTGSIAAAAVLNLPPEATDWTEIRASETLPATIRSFRVDAFCFDPFECTIAADRIYVGPADPVFLDGFEIQDTCRW